MIVFQLLLLLLLALPLLSSGFGVVLLALAYAVVLISAAFKALNLDASQRAPAGVLLAFFALLSLGMTAALMLQVPIFLIGSVSAGLLGVFFAVLAWRFSAPACELVGWTNAYAVVRVPKSLVSVVPAGVYAVKCPKKPVKKTVRVRFSFFKKEGVVEN